MNTTLTEAQQQVEKLLAAANLSLVDQAMVRTRAWHDPELAREIIDDLIKMTPHRVEVDGR